MDRGLELFTVLFPIQEKLIEEFLRFQHIHILFHQDVLNMSGLELFPGMALVEVFNIFLLVH